jgi:DNA-directed RNA polymerase subunit alpha
MNVWIAKNWRSLIRPRELVIDAATSTHARLDCEPLERGFGTTLGVLLRRTLLSAFPGAAITCVAGELPRDPTEILLALKEVVFASEHPAAVRLVREGECIVTGADLELPAGVRCVNPSLRLCRLGAGERIALALELAIGRGYVPADRQPSRDGAIALDAMFSPVRRVDVSVTNARVGHQTDYDRLVLDVWTNGAIDPVDAARRAAAIVQDQLAAFINFEEVPEPIPPPRDEAAERLDENLWRTVDELELSVRAENCLRALNIRYIGELVQKTEAELMKSRGFGRKSLTEISSVLAEMNLQLGMKLEHWSKADPGEPASS